MGAVAPHGKSLIVVCLLATCDAMRLNNFLLMVHYLPEATKLFP